MSRNKLVTNITKVIVTGSVLSVLTAGTVFAAVGITTTSDLNIRAESSVKSDILGKLEANKELDIIEREGDFFKIAYDDTEAYVSADFVSMKDGFGTVNGDNVNVRETAKDTAPILGQVSSGAVINLLGRSDEFILFDYKGKKAYIHNSFVNSEFKENLQPVSSDVNPRTYGTVNYDNLKLFKDRSIDSEVLSELPKGNIVDVVEHSDGWAKAQLEDGTVGFMDAESLEIVTGIKPAKDAAGSEFGSLEGSDQAQAVVAFAKEYLGTPYVYGGTALGKGVDCSGFVQSVYKNFDVSLNRTSSAMPSNGVYVSKANLEPGDLVFFGVYGSRNIGHVGIYTGDGKFIHAASGNPRKVTISSLSESYYATNYKSGARVLQ